MTPSPQVMGILNITTDSFFDGGKYYTIEQAECRIEKLVEDGVDIIDVGACSTRPGAKMLSSNEEIKALDLVLKYIRTKHGQIPLSVDTFQSSVARWAHQEYGVDMINDISGGSLDDKMFDCIADIQCSYILMHSRGTPQTMQHLTSYEDLMQEIMVTFAEKKNQLRMMGVKDIIIDPGFGFAKTLEQNYLLLKKLDYLSLLELPILVGVSRKSMIQKVLECSASESLNGTTVLHTLALMNGANILRVHDVKEAKECVQIIKQYETTN